LNFKKNQSKIQNFKINYKSEGKNSIKN